MSVSAESLRSAIDNVYQANPEALLVGSLGRAAYFGQRIGDPFIEYDLIGQEPLRRDKKKNRDIDVILGNVVKETKISEIFPVDSECFNRYEVSISKQDGDWWLISDCYRFSERLAPEVMQPMPAKTIYDINCLVPPIQTLYSLSGVPLVRPKDLLARQALLPLVEANSNFPDELFLPFRKLYGVASEGFIGRISDVYRGVIPDSIRRIVRPATKLVRSKLIEVEKDLKTGKTEDVKVLAGKHARLG